MSLDPNKPSLLQRLGHFFTKTFYDKNMKDHQRSIDSLHKEESKDKWDSFADKAKDSSFVDAVKNDPRSDDKLKMHVARLNDLHNGNQVASIRGSRGKSYTVTKLPNGDFGCSCNDWRYKGSVTPGYKCKHIREHIVRSRHGN